MNIIIKENQVGHCFRINNVSVLSTLTFGSIKDNEILYPILLRLVQKNIIHAFKVKDGEIHIEFYTKNIEVL